MKETTLDINIGINSSAVLSELKKIGSNVTGLASVSTVSMGKISDSVKGSTYSLKGLSSIAQSSSESITQGFKSMLGAGLAMGIGLSGIKNIFQFQQEAISVQRLSDNLGITTERISKMHQAIEEIGGSSGSLDATLMSLSKAQQEFKSFGQGAFKDVQRKYGVSVGGTADEQLLKISDRMQGLSRSKQIDLAGMLGIDEQLLPLLRKGRTEIEAILSKKTKGLISEKDAENALEMQKSLVQIKANFSEIGRSLMTILAPALQAVSGSVRWFFGLFSKYEGLAVASIVAIGLALTPVLVILYNMAVAVIGIVSPFLLVGVAVLGVIALLQELWTWIKGGDSIINDIFMPLDEWLKHLTRTFQIFKDLWDSWKGLVSDAVDGVINIFGGGSESKQPLPETRKNPPNIVNNVQSTVNASKLTTAQTEQAISKGISDGLVNQSASNEGI